MLTVLPPLLLSAIATITCYVGVGPTTGLFFGGLVVATLVAPPLVLAESSTRRQFLRAAAVTAGVAGVCLFAATDPSVTLVDWLKFTALLSAYVLCLWGLGALLVRLHVAPLLASAVVVVLSLAWLAWPVWLSPWLAGRERLVGWLAAAHPLLGLDGALRHLGPPWSERYWMYNVLTVLNQDVMYELPRGAWPAALVHGAVGGLALAAARGLRGKRDGAAGPPAPPPAAAAA